VVVFCFAVNGSCSLFGARISTVTLYVSVIICRE